MYRVFSASFELLDCLYINDRGKRTKQQNNYLTVQYESNGVVQPQVINNDGLMDLFVGTRMISWKFCLLVNKKLLINTGDGRFRDVTMKMALGLEDIGLITDARRIDYDCHGDFDLLITGEWMAILLFEKNKKLRNVDSEL